MTFKNLYQARNANVASECEMIGCKSSFEIKLGFLIASLSVNSRVASISQSMAIMLRLTVHNNTFQSKCSLMTPLPESSSSGRGSKTVHHFKILA